MKIEDVFKKKIPYVTIGLILINTIIFILMYVMNNEDYYINKYSVSGFDIVNNGETRYQIKMYVRNKRR